MKQRVILERLGAIIRTYKLELHPDRAFLRSLRALMIQIENELEEGKD